MRGILIISDIPKQTPDNPEEVVKYFMQSAHKLPPDSVNAKTFYRVYCLSPKNNNRPRAIVAKFEHKQKTRVLITKEYQEKGRQVIH